jgi:UDP-N-acetylmuramoyl-L-alanyl-D-glutamate--2,6-diaminopimelate ligase
MPTITHLLEAWHTAVAGTNYAQPPMYHGTAIELANLVEHTSDVIPGSCFVARVRTTSDGHPYIPQAIERGASLILGQHPPESLGFALPEHVPYLQVEDTAVASAWLASAWYGFPSREMIIIGVTGTDGKTSTSNLIFSILRSAGYKTGLISTINAIIGDHEEPTGLHVSTPEAPAVQAYLRRMADVGTTHVVLESTSHGLAQHRVTAVDYNIAVVTNITHEHLDYHGSYEAYREAKGRLFEMVAQGEAAHGGLRTAVLNRDDSSYDYLAALPISQQISYALDQSATIQATELQFAADGLQFTAVSPLLPAPLPIRSPLVGRFNVANILAAISTAVALGIEGAIIQAGITAVPSISGRMQPIEEGQNFLVIVDFAHTPNALARAIEAARPLIPANGRIITVFGSAGKRDVAKRRLMAEISAQTADISVLTAEDPRTEPLDDILAMMADGCLRHGGREGETFYRVPDRGRAIYHALTLAQPDDVVLVCGKGHEQSMCFITTEYPWDDREATRAALRAFLAHLPMVDLGLPTFQSEM